MSRSPCVRCGMILHTGEGKVAVAFTVAEMIDLAWAAWNAGDTKVVDRLLCAVGLLDEAKERATHAAMREARTGAAGDA